MRFRITALVSVLALALAACSGGDGDGESAETIDGPTITVASFNFAESTILAEMYAQALEDAASEIGVIL